MEPYPCYKNTFVFYSRLFSTPNFTHLTVFTHITLGFWPNLTITWLAWPRSIYKKVYFSFFGVYLNEKNENDKLTPSKDIFPSVPFLTWRQCWGRSENFAQYSLLSFLRVYLQTKNKKGPLLRRQMINEYFNFTDWDHFGSQLNSTIFARHRDCTGKQFTKSPFISFHSKNTFFFQIIIHFWVNLGAFCQKIGKPAVYPPKSSSLIVQHSCPSNIYKRSEQQICQSGENWVQTNTLRGTPALHKGSINLFTRMVTPWLAFYLNRNIIFSAIYLFCYFIKKWTNKIQ